ncbi:hypothetical protein [Rhodococcus sp. EPR-157]|uniref:hypothetical protein n=1 Tax=Rhodococcus sp. EPR-157 TaxID=1813677 RepID=UPI000A43CF32|nr:hypothetical protein [Rhodococcus sp. EPR-157]
MKDFGDRLKRIVCDVCERPFDQNRIIPNPNICRDCRAVINHLAVPMLLDEDGEAEA